ncbi:LuxR C-terminal-related transcriptional regulator [Paenibacillus agri]|uniref:HTH luxR-type domain-containing protein n=1 Tax=Paenibacillus agri TaxID=2744309 RepID=A0A850EMD4_9BACL|nr:LuxR C-terminal-related transcriptional regulator [Paenibacillus agri]NUU62473.1 hypothetical protein [Paenibacillus agri]
MKDISSTYQDSMPYIMEKTEGWVAGLILVSLAIGPDALRQDGIAQAQPYISEFVLQEIIETLPLPTQKFLLYTSLLNELEPTICDHLTHRTDSLDLLEELERKGLFIVRIQTLQPVFRYHQLFADALQLELKREISAQQLQQLVQQTANFIYDTGDYISAIELVLRYERYEIAVPWITHHLVELYLSGQAVTFIRWLQGIQSSPYQATYEMLVIGFITSISAGDVGLSSSLMQELEKLQLTERWMEQEEHAAIVYIYETTKAYAIIAAGGDLQAMSEIIKKQITKGHIPSRWDNIPMPYNIFEYKLLRTSLGSKGKLPFIEEGAVITQLFRGTFLQTWNVTAFSYGVSAESLYERNLIELAQQDIETALRLGHQFQDPGLFIPMYLLKAKIYAQQNQMISAQAMLSGVLEQVSEKHWITSLRIMQAYCYIVAGDIQHAESILQSTTTKQPFWMLVYARLLLLKEQPEAALTVLIGVKTKAQQDEQIATILEATVLEVICHHRLDNQDTALAILHEALTLAAPYYYIRTFLDEPEILPLLDKYFKLEKLEEQWGTIPAHYFKYLLEGTKTIPEKNELLTPREQEVFDLLVDGITNRQIAQQLDLSEGTIRVYLSTIYNKLGVSSRAKAILLKKQ